MQSKVGPLFILLVVAVGLVSWGLLGDDGTDLEGLSPASSEASVGSSSASLRDVAPTKNSELAPPIRETLSSRVAGPNTRDDGVLDVSGTVMDADGVVMGSATIHIREHEEPEFMIEDYDPFKKRIKASSAGRFDVQVDRQGEFVLWAESKEHGASDLVRVRLNPREPKAEVKLQLTRRKTIRGVVLDDELKPVPSAKVIAIVDVEHAGISMPGGITSVEYFGISEALTAADGTFELQTARSGDELFTVRAEGRVPRPKEVRTANGRLLGTSTDYVRAVAELTYVAPGDSALSLIFRDDASFNASVRVELSSLDGGELPAKLSYTLNEVCPNGGIYSTITYNQYPDAVGVMRTTSVRAGRRYELTLEKGRVGETRVGSFIALSGENTLRASLPGHFPVTFRIKRGPESLNKGVSLRVTLIHGPGATDRYGQEQIAATEEERTIKLPAGSFELEVTGAEITAGLRMSNVLCRQSFSVSSESLTVDLKLK